MHEENTICSKTLICRQLFAGHVVSSWAMKRKEKIHPMIIIIIVIDLQQHVNATFCDSNNCERYAQKCAEWTLLASTYCFPISDRVMFSWEFSFCLLCYVYIFICIRWHLKEIIQLE